MVLHAAWQLVILFVLIFCVGDVCKNANIANKTCTMAPLSKLGFMGSTPFAIPSGRPFGYDLASTAASGACPPAFDPKDPKTFKTSLVGLVTPLRPPDFCKHQHGSAADTSQQYTMVFNVFVLMQFFNEINSRKIHNEINVFEGIFKNFLLIGIVAGTLMAQVALVEMGGVNTAFGCQSLSSMQWVICLGGSVLPMNVLFRFVPSSIFPGAPTGGDTVV